GPYLQRTLIGGTEYGTATLTRFFAIHTYVLPAAAMALAALHLYLLRRHGITPRWSVGEADLEAKREPFWPRQAFRDSAMAFAVVAALGAVVIARHGVGLDAPADPASSYLARP